MSQLDEALKRSRLEQMSPAGPSRVSSLEESAAARRSAAFVSAWELHRFGEAEREPVENLVTPEEKGRAAAPPSAAAAGTPEIVVEPGSPIERSWNFDETVLERLVVAETMESFVREQYRKLAAVLHQHQEARHVGIVMIASAAPAEGKSLTAANLALTLSESYRRRVLLIDADLRRPMLHHIFNVPKAAGLNEGLKSAAEIRLPIVRISPQLWLLPGGSPDADPLGGLTSDRMHRLIAEARTEFDWVILDTPPVTLLPDAKLVVSMADAAVLVIKAGSTPCALAQRTIDAIGRERIVGVVLNQSSAKAGAVDYGYGDYYRAYNDDGGRSEA